MGTPSAGICRHLIAALVRYIDPVASAGHAAFLVEPDKADPAAKIQVRDRGFLPILVKAAAVGFNEVLYRLCCGRHAALLRGDPYPFVRFIIFTTFCVIIIATRICGTFTVCASIHGAGMVQYQHSCRRTGVLLRFRLLQDNLQRDFVLVRVRGRFRGLGDRFNASRQLALVEGSLFPGRIFIVAIFDVATRTCSGSIPVGSQRYRREQADGQDQRQQQGYDSFHHFFFSPSCMVQFFCFLLSFFYVQRPGGRGLGGRVQSGDDLSVACGDSSPGRGAFSFRCGGAPSQALRASSPSQGEPRGLQEFPSAVPAEGKKRVPSFGSSWGG